MLQVFVNLIIKLLRLSLKEGLFRLINTAVNVIEQGKIDDFLKPFTDEELLPAVETVAKKTI